MDYFYEGNIDCSEESLLSVHKMGCPALGIWVAFLKQLHALPVQAPQKNKNYIFLNNF
jgi:hypothetical protein